MSKVTIEPLPLNEKNTKIPVTSIPDYTYFFAKLVYEDKLEDTIRWPGYRLWLKAHHNLIDLELFDEIRFENLANNFIVEFYDYQPVNVRIISTPIKDTPLLMKEVRTTNVGSQKCYTQPNKLWQPWRTHCRGEGFSVGRIRYTKFPSCGREWEREYINLRENEDVVVFDTLQLANQYADLLNIAEGDFR